MKNIGLYLLVELERKNKMNTLTKKVGNKRVMTSTDLKLCKVHRSVFFKKLIGEMNFIKTENIPYHVSPKRNHDSIWFKDERNQIYLHLYSSSVNEVHVDIFRNVNGLRVEVCGAHSFTKRLGLSESGSILINAIRKAYVEHFAYRN